MSLIKFDEVTRRHFLQGLGASTVASALPAQATGHLPVSSIVATGTGAPLLIERIERQVHFPVREVCYVVANPRSNLDKRMLEKLTSYIEATVKKKPKVVSNLRDVPSKHAIILVAYSSEASVKDISVPDGSPESFVLVTGKSDEHPAVAAIANTDRGLKRAVQRLIINSKQNKNSLEIPDCNFAEKPWIPEREYALGMWAPRYSRGSFFNPYADERMNIWAYSSDQVNSYVEMYDWFGFSGIQLMETCYGYGLFGSVEAFQDRLKGFACAARNNGQNVSLWVWAAEFSHYNWVDLEVTCSTACGSVFAGAAYTPANGNSAFLDPKVRKAFEKYYNYYANLAPYVDRLIAHFYDPGNLTNRSDVFNYMRLLESKFRAKNPHIQMAVDMWAAKPDYLSELVDNGFKDYLILEEPHWLKPEQREALHEEAKRLGLEVGLWGWDSTGMETDQLPSMYVNCGVLKKYYQEIKNSSAEVYPYRYWSEMEAHHLNNIYSEYVASQLLWNPDRDPYEILRELTDGIWGPENGNTVYTALKLIEDTRSGPSWHTYWWREPNYRLGTDDPGSDAQRAESSVSALEDMKVNTSFVPKFPLPFPPSTFIELMLPHLRQIQAFAQFRVKLAELQSNDAIKTDKNKISQQLAAIWEPIPEYTTWIGTFGQNERRNQEILVQKYAVDAGVEVKAPGWLRSEEAHRLLEKIQNWQMARQNEWHFTPQEINEFWWSENKTQERLDSLRADGWVEEVAEGIYRLVNWDHYAAQARIK